MIRNDSEYKRTLARITEHHLRLVDRREELELEGVPDDQIDQLLADLQYNCRGLEDDVAAYERYTAPTWVPAV